MGSVHIPVLLQHVIEGLALTEGATVVDATLGGGGYSRALCEVIGNTGVLIGIDQDKKAVTRVTHTLNGLPCAAHLVEANFRELSKVLKRQGVKMVDGIVFDLGFSSFQIADSGRGFSFQNDEPLLMTYKETPETSDSTARDIVNDWSEEGIANALFGYGEERYARRIARAIVRARETSPIETTTQLTEIIERAVPSGYRRGKIHPATKTFQALRIATNDELRALEEALEAGWEHLRVGGHIAVVSFHSLEDRIVKHFFKAKAQDKEGKLITKKPISPTEEEIRNNPRSRSAKLRIIEKV